MGMGWRCFLELNCVSWSGKLKVQVAAAAGAEGASLWVVVPLLRLRLSHGTETGSPQLPE